MGLLSFLGIEVVVEPKQKRRSEYPCDFCGSNCGQCGISGPTEDKGARVLERAARAVTKRSRRED